MPPPLLLLGAVGLLAAAQAGAWLALARALAPGPLDGLPLALGLTLGTALGVALGGWIEARGRDESARPARRAGLLAVLAGGLLALVPPAPATWEAVVAAAARWCGTGSETAAAVAVLLPGLALTLPAGLLLGMLGVDLYRGACHHLDRNGPSLGRLALAALAGGAGGVLLAQGLPSAAEGARPWALCAWGAALLLLLADRPLPHGTGPPPGGQPGVVDPPRLLFTGVFGALAALGVGWVALWRLGAALWIEAPEGAALPLLLGAAGLSLGAAIGGRVAGWRGERGYTAAFPLLLCGGLFGLGALGAADLPVDLLLGAASERGLVLVRAAALAFGLPALGLGLAIVGWLGQRAQWSGAAARELGRILGRAGLGLATGVGLGLGAAALGAGGGALVLAAVAALVLLAWLACHWGTPRAALRWRLLHAGVPLALLLPPVHGALIGSAPEPALALAATRPRPPGIALASPADAALYAEFFCGVPAPTVPARGSAFASARALRDGADGWTLLLGARAAGSVVPPGVPQRSLEVAVLAACLMREPGAVLLLGWGNGGAARVLAAAGARVTVSDAPAALRELSADLAPEPPPPAGGPAGTVGAQAAPAAVSVLAAPSAAPQGYDLVVRWQAGIATPADAWLSSPAGVERLHAALAERGHLVLAVRPERLGGGATDALTRALLTRFARVAVFRLGGQVVFVGQRRPEPLALARWVGLLEGSGVLAEAARAADLPSAAHLLARLWTDDAALRRALAPDASGADSAPPPPDPAAAAAPLPAGRLDPLAGLLIEAADPPEWNAWLPNHPIQERWLARAALAALEAEDLASARRLGLLPALGGGPTALRVRARTLRALGQPEVAARLLVQATRAHPADVELAAEWYETLAHLAPDEAERQQALAGVREAAAGLGPDTPARLWLALARAARGLGAADRAAQIYRAAVEGGPPEVGPEARAELARLLVSLEPADSAGAWEALADPTTLPEDPVVLDLAVRLAGRFGTPEQADALEARSRSVARQRAARELSLAFSHLRAHEFLRAYAAAAAAADLDGELVLAREVQGLAALCVAPRGPTEVAERQRKAAVPLLDALDRDPTAARRARVERILAWAGLSLAP